ncbi:hypothetical protein [uncultured Alcanivorax sp.]|jgi:hypothetical protein|uniref:hypothetical protein n=1 Tax=uncultured Alcanivorax sp. TaxID=191215 RepID=UPI0025F41D97|nr:hypothetical protein [uncultured Alcanivorax sp.]
MAKYLVEIEDTADGVKVTATGGDLNLKPSEARDLVIGLLVSTKGLLTIGKALVGGPTRPAKRELH